MTPRRFSLSLVLALGLIGSAQAQQQPVPELSLDMAVLGGLDKITARVVTIEAPVGEPVRFGTLEVVARACKKRRPEESPESAAFLDIWDIKAGQPAQGVFRGWMFASSPALSALENPVYDVWVVDCRKPGKER